MKGLALNGEGASPCPCLEVFLPGGSDEGGAGGAEPCLVVELFLAGAAPIGCGGGLGGKVGVSSSISEPRDSAEPAFCFFCRFCCCFRHLLGGDGLLGKGSRLELRSAFASSEGDRCLLPGPC